MLQNIYTYEKMECDIQILQRRYPKWIIFDSLGETVDRRQLYHFVVGKPQAANRILISGGMHGREYMTSQLVMKQLFHFLQHLEAGDVYQQDWSYARLLEEKAIHGIPMVNPDGISISQLGLKGIQTEENRRKVLRIAQWDGKRASGKYLENWKANGRGVDLNRNFDAQWEIYKNPADHPSSEHYKGTAPGCEVESKALIQLTRKEKFVRTISYHSQGSVIYWYFFQEGTLYKNNLKFGKRIAALTGYLLENGKEAVMDPAGYKDWAISQEGIPSLTIEIGKECSPVPQEQFPKIWEENKFVWEETLLDLVE